MALSVTSKQYGPEKLLDLQVLAFLLQYALENDVDFVDDSDLEDWMLGATDAQQEHVLGMNEDEQFALLTDLNVLLSAAFSESEEITFSADFSGGDS